MENLLAIIGVIISISALVCFFLLCRDVSKIRNILEIGYAQKKSQDALAGGKTSKKTWTCPSCGFANNSSVSFTCSNCGYSLNE